MNNTFLKIYFLSIISLLNSQLSATTYTLEIDSLPRIHTVHGAYADQGKRKNMEDVHVHLSDQDSECWAGVRFYGVFDGHGGARAAHYAAKILGINVLTNLQKSSDEPFESHIAKGFLTTHNSYRGPDGTTAVVAFIQGNNLFIANTGDSRAILSQNGRAIKVSKDHKPEDHLEKKRIEIAGGTVSVYEDEENYPMLVCVDFDENEKPIIQSKKKTIHRLKVNRIDADGNNIEHSLAMSRAIGDHKFGRSIVAIPSIKKILLNGSQEFLLLVSDGVSDTITNQAAIEFVLMKMKERGATMQTITTSQAEEIAQELVELVQSISNHDNATAMLIFFKCEENNKWICKEMCSIS